MKAVTIVDYGRSNLLSVQRALERCGARVRFAAAPGEVLSADALVLPGVGAFADGMAQLERRGLAGPLRQKAAQGAPVLGICLGMQLLFDESEEDGPHPGLGLVPGRVARLPQLTANGEKLAVPHVGWGSLQPAGGRTDFAGTALAGLENGAEVYFVHSFAAQPALPAHRLADTLYGGRAVCAAVQAGNVLGVQFHPEKSAKAGLGILTAFLRQL